MTSPSRLPTGIRQREQFAVDDARLGPDVADDEADPLAVAQGLGGDGEQQRLVVKDGRRICSLLRQYRGYGERVERDRDARLLDNDALDEGTDGGSLSAFGALAAVDAAGQL